MPSEFKLLQGSKTPKLNVKNELRTQAKNNFMHIVMHAKKFRFILVLYYLKCTIIPVLYYLKCSIIPVLYYLKCSFIPVLYYLKCSFIPVLYYLKCSIIPVLYYLKCSFIPVLYYLKCSFKSFSKNLFYEGKFLYSRLTFLINFYSKKHHFFYRYFSTDIFQISLLKMILPIVAKCYKRKPIDKQFLNKYIWDSCMAL